MPIEDVSLSVQLKACTGVGTLPRRVERLAVAQLDTRSPRMSLSAMVPSRRLSGRLRLEALVVLDRASDERHVLSPCLPGSRLWSHRKEVLLEDGGDARFPIELVGFGEAFRGTEHESAPWYAHWRPGEMDADFAGAVRVYVNNDNEELAKRFVEGDPLTLEAILGDVVSQMVASTVALDDADEMLGECPESSVGGQVRNWLDIAFPGHSLASVRASLETTPGRFRAALLSAARIGDEG